MHNVKSANQYRDEILIEKAVKTTIQRLYYKRLFDNYDNAEAALKYCLLIDVYEMRRSNLDEQIITFNVFVYEFNLRNQTASTKTIYHILPSLSLNDVEKYLRDGTFSTFIGIAVLHPTKGTQSVAYINQNWHEVGNPFCGSYFDSFGGLRPEKLSVFNIKRNGSCLYCECKVQGLRRKRDSYCALYVLYNFREKRGRNIF